MINFDKRCDVRVVESAETPYIKITRKNGEIICAAIDKDFINEAKKYHWQYTNAGYVRTTQTDGGVFLHHMVYHFFKGNIPNGNLIDHINGDNLDNRIYNLRTCSASENAQNTRKCPIITNGGIAGVRKDVRCKNSWRAQIYLTNGSHLERTYKDRELAIIQRFVWELENFNEFAPQIDRIKKDYPFLLNYMMVKDNMKFSTDISTIRDIGKSLTNDPHCPCMIKKDDNTLCPCLPCRTKNHCHCGMFEYKTQNRKD